MDKLPVILGSIAAFVSIMTGCGYWLISQYFNQSKELERLKESITSGAIKKLEGVVSELKHEMELLKARVIEAEGKMLSSIARFEFVQKNVDRMNAALTKILESSEKRFASKQTKRDEGI